MRSLNRKNIKYFIILVIVSLGIIKFFNTPYNFYSILNWNYENRMKQAYGFCENESWGFYKLITKKFELEKNDITIINDEGHVTLEYFFNLKKNTNKNNNFVIILNYNSRNNENILSGKYNFLQNYNVKYRYNNCYLLKLND